MKNFVSVLLGMLKMHCSKFVYKISENFIDCCRCSFKHLLLLVKSIVTFLKIDGLIGMLTDSIFID